MWSGAKGLQTGIASPQQYHRKITGNTLQVLFINTDNVIYNIS